jgi:hypothetical protein
MPLIPSFDELRESHLASARRLSRAEAVAQLETNAVLAHPASAEQKKEILALAAGTFGPAERARCQELLLSALRAQDFLLRPETADEVWRIEGLLDRLG